MRIGPVMAKMNSTVVTSESANLRLALVYDKQGKKKVQHGHDQDTGPHRDRQVPFGMVQLAPREADVVPGIHREERTHHY